MCMCMCMYACMYVYMHVYVELAGGRRAPIDMSVGSAQLHTHTHIHTYTHTHIHTYTWFLMESMGKVERQRKQKGGSGVREKIYSEFEVRYH